MKSGLEPDRAVVVRDRLVVPPAPASERPRLLCATAMRLELRGGAMLRDRLVEAAVLAQRVAEIEARRRVIGIERDRARPVVRRFAPPPERREREADIVVEVRLLVDARARGRSGRRPRRCARPYGRARRADAAHARGRLRGEHLRVEAVGLGELAGLMVAHRGDEGFGGSHAARKRGSPAKSILDFHLEQRGAQATCHARRRRARWSRRRRAHACRRTAVRRDAATHSASPRP